MLHLFTSCNRVYWRFFRRTVVARPSDAKKLQIATRMSLSDDDKLFYSLGAALAGQTDQFKKVNDHWETVSQTLCTYFMEACGVVEVHVLC